MQLVLFRFRYYVFESVAKTKYWFTVLRVHTSANMDEEITILQLISYGDKVISQLVTVEKLYFKLN